MAELEGSRAAPRRVVGDAVRLCEPRSAALGEHQRPARAALQRRRCGVAQAAPRCRAQGRVDRGQRTRLRHAGARIGPHPDRARPPLLSRLGGRAARPQLLARDRGAALVAVRRAAVRRQEPAVDVDGAAPGLAGRRGPRAGRSLPAAAAGRRALGSSELGRGPRRHAGDRRTHPAAARRRGDRRAALRPAGARAARVGLGRSGRARAVDPCRAGAVGRP